MKPRSRYIAHSSSLTQERSRERARCSGLRPERRDELALFGGDLGIAFGEQDLAVTGLHAQELHRLAIMTKGRRMSQWIGAESRHMTARLFFCLVAGLLVGALGAPGMASA